MICLSNLWTYLMRFIIFERTWWCLLSLNVPDEFYYLWMYPMRFIIFERTWWGLLSLNVPDDVYYLWTYLMMFIIFERTWWGLLSLNVHDEVYYLWMYLMRFISETRHAHWIWYQCFCFLYVRKEWRTVCCSFCLQTKA
jgi:hypothetical protein